MEYLAGQSDMILRCLSELKADQRQRWDKQERDNTRLHKRLDDLVGEDFVTSDECEHRCGEIEANQGSVKPVVAYVGIPLLIEGLNLAGQHWTSVKVFMAGLLRGG